MTTPVALARRAVAKAARVRLRARLSAYEAICVYDLVQSMEIDLWFQAVPTLEGMYSPGDPPIIVVSALRPAGRQRLNCGHELGHHVFGHGTRLDQLVEHTERSGFDPDEFLVNCFAEYLLMPKVAVLAALNERQIDLSTAAPTDVFRLASYFGVGYRTIIHHLHSNLRELPSGRATTLRKVTPKAIREGVVGTDFQGELILADEAWRGRPIDLHVGDALLMPTGACHEGDRLTELRDGPFGRVYVAERPGLGRVASSAWASYVRVARRVPGGGFVGRSLYRHEEDSDAQP